MDRRSPFDFCQGPLDVGLLCRWQKYESNIESFSESLYHNPDQGSNSKPNEEPHCAANHFAFEVSDNIANRSAESRRFHDLPSILDQT